MIELQIDALYMDVLTNNMRRLQLEDKEIILLHHLWDEICVKYSSPFTVEVNYEEDSMEVTIGELRVPAIYFRNEKKYWQNLQHLLKLQTQWKQWLKDIIWIKEAFTTWY